MCAAQRIACGPERDHAAFAEIGVEYGCYIEAGGRFGQSGNDVLGVVADDDRGAGHTGLFEQEEVPLKKAAAAKFEQYLGFMVAVRGLGAQPAADPGGQDDRVQTLW